MSKLKVDLEVWPAGARANFRLGDIPIGHAHLSIEGSNAELSDIILLERGPHPIRLLHFIGFRRTYRGHGIGSLLMPLLIARLCDHGIKRISGTIKSNRDSLPNWYRRMGFHVDDRTGRISMDLGSGSN